MYFHDILSFNENSSMECPRCQKSQITEEIRFIQKKHQPDLIFLLETMVTEENTKRLISRLGFHYHDFSNPIDHSGGI